MKKMTTFALLTFAIFGLIQNVEASAKTRNCGSNSLAKINQCLELESKELGEANLPNEVIVEANKLGRDSLNKMILELTKGRSDKYALELKAKLSLVNNAIATALIIVYEDEPKLFYYTVDSKGQMTEIFDGLNSIDLSSNFPTLFKNDPSVFHLKSKNVSSSWLEWMGYLNE